MSIFELFVKVVPRGSGQNHTLIVFKSQRRHPERSEGSPENGNFFYLLEILHFVQDDVTLNNKTCFILIKMV